MPVWCEFVRGMKAIIRFDLFPPFLLLPECSQMSSRCSSELRCDTSYFSKKLLRSMHIHTHVPLLVCCNASAWWVVVKTQLSSGRHSTQSRIVELSCCWWCSCSWRGGSVLPRPSCSRSCISNTWTPKVLSYVPNELLCFCLVQN